ncbi:hypothetical protein SDC9_93194 [bioreactor metagenome]|uniref:Uncharacterized protein n=1 Tax=bioreactor metagenome TaxID=1076179 RepID=A0A645A2K7_9ZZZZ
MKPFSSNIKDNIDFSFESTEATVDSSSESITSSFSFIYCPRISKNCTSLLSSIGFASSKGFENQLMILLEKVFLTSVILAVGVMSGPLEDPLL